jgi:hypothetical protein
MNRTETSGERATKNAVVEVSRKIMAALMKKEGSFESCEEIARPKMNTTITIKLDQQDYNTLLIMLGMAAALMEKIVKSAHPGDIRITAEQLAMAGVNLGEILDISGIKPEDDGEK